MTTSKRLQLSPGTIRIALAIAAVFLIGFSATFTMGAAQAGMSTSTQGSFNHGGAYGNVAVVSGNRSNHLAQAYTHTFPLQHTAPSGYVGSRGRLFNASTGRLRCEGSNTYNPTPLVNGATVTGYACQAFGEGAWYSYGVSRVFNGSTWKNYYTFKTGNQNS